MIWGGRGEQCCSLGCARGGITQALRWQSLPLWSRPPGVDAEGLNLFLNELNSFLRNLYSLGIVCGCLFTSSIQLVPSRHRILSVTQPRRRETLASHCPVA